MIIKTMKKMMRVMMITRMILRRIVIAKLPSIKDGF